MTESDSFLEVDVSGIELRYQRFGSHTVYYLHKSITVALAP